MKLWSVWMNEANVKNSQKLEHQFPAPNSKTESPPYLFTFLFYEKMLIHSFIFVRYRIFIQVKRHKMCQKLTFNKV